MRAGRRDVRQANSLREEKQMSKTINSALFGWYPYLCLTVFLLGSLLRFDREQYTWKTGSSPAPAQAPAPLGLEPLPCRHPGDLRSAISSAC